MNVTIKTCARCGQDHLNLEFEKLIQASGEYEWWAPCPTNHQPILLAIITEEFVSKYLMVPVARGAVESK